MVCILYVFAYNNFVQKINIKVIFLFLGLLPVGHVFAALDEDFKTAFPDLVQNLCASTVRYDLESSSPDATFEDREARFEAKKNEYHTKINCIFNEAMAGLMEETNKSMKDLSQSRFLWLRNFPPVSKECKGVFSDTQVQQEGLRRSRNRPRTVCDTGGESKSVEAPYSACHITEMVMSEWCGYQKYLWAKKQDDTAFLETSSKVKSISDLFNEVSPMEDAVDQELQKSHQTLLDALFFYRHFEQNYRFHAWLETIKPAVQLISNKLALIRGVINTFPEKFINQQKQ